MTPAESRLVEILRGSFGGRDDAHLIERPNGAAWIPEPATDAMLARHVRGEDRIGLPCDPERAAFVLADFDGKHDGDDGSRAFHDARRLVEALDADLGMVPLVERSRSGAGFHVWIMFDDADPPTLAEARRLLAAALRLAGLPDDGDESKGHPGQFPHPPGPKGIGRAPFLPWHGFGNGKGSGLFVDCTGDVLADQEAALKCADRIDRGRLLRVIEAAEAMAPPPARPERTMPVNLERRTPAGRSTRYRLAALARQCEAVRSAAPGTRHNALNMAAFRCGRWIAGNELDRAHAEAELREAASALIAEGREREVENTIRDGIEAGLQEPRSAPLRRSSSPTTRERGNSEPTADINDAVIVEAGETWTEPILEAGSTSLEPEAEVPELPAEVWRGPFEDYRRALDRSTEAANSFHFASFAVVAGLVVARRSFLVYGRWIFPALFACLIGPTGRSRKSTAISRGHAALAEVTEEVQTLGTCSWEGLLDALKGEDKRVLLSPAEFRLLAAKASERTTSSLVPGLTELYDCPPALRHKTRASDADARRPFGAILTASTLEWFRDSFDESAIAGGFLNRWIFVDGNPKTPNPFPDEPEPTAWRAAVDALKTLDDRLARPDPMRLSLDPDARLLWKEFYTEATTWRHPSELSAKMAERVPEMALKLALLFALLDGAQSSIRDEHLAAAMAFARWERDAHLRVLEGFGDSRHKRIEALIRKRIQAFHGKQLAPKRREVQRALGGKCSAEEFNRGLRALLEAGALEEDRESKCLRLL